MGNDCSATINKTLTKPILPDHDIVILRKSYNLLKTKGLTRTLASESIQMILARVPEALQAFYDSTTDSEDKKSGLMGNGEVLLKGIEFALTQLDKPAWQFKNYIQRLAARHWQRHGVSAYMMVEAVDSFESVIIPHLQATHNHIEDARSQISLLPHINPKEEKCDICGTWERFLGIVRNLFAATATSKQVEVV